MGFGVPAESASGRPGRPHEDQHHCRGDQTQDAAEGHGGRQAEIIDDAAADQGAGRQGDLHHRDQQGLAGDEATGGAVADADSDEALEAYNRYLERMNRG